MMLPSHLLGAVVLALLIGLLRGKPLRGREWGLALAFGVAVDLDHALAFPGFVLSYGMAALDPAVGLGYGSAWQGFMHSPWALLVVAPAMWWWRSLLPLVFWGLHMWQDFYIARHHVVFGSLEEWLVVGALALTAWGLFALQQRSARGAQEAAYEPYANPALSR